MKRGDVYRFNLDPVIGSEIKKTRMCVVVMVDPRDTSPLTIVCPLSDANDRRGNLLNPAVAAGLGGTTKDSRVVCTQIRALDKRRRVGEKLGELPPSLMSEVSTGLKAVLGLH